MITLRDLIEIKTTLERTFEFFIHFEENYQAWHHNHIKCCWLKGKLFEEEMRK